MERLEQVFVSSTYTDLVEERQEVIQTLLEADCIPAGMELFPAASEDRWTLIQRVISNCDFYIVVIGGRYGSIDRESGLSFTEREYDYAQQLGKPIMVFLHGAPGRIEVDRSELDPAARHQLEKFRAKLQESHVCKFWTSPAELGGLVAKSLIQIRKTSPAEGWVRGRYALTPERETEIADLKRQIAELREREAVLTADLERALGRAPVGTENLAQGGDRVPIRYTVRQKSASGFQPDAIIAKAAIEPTWDEVIAAIGPQMIDEVSNGDIVSAIAKMARRLVNPPQGSSIAPISLTVDAEDVDTVRMQLLALGMIEPGTRKRPISDTGHYWKLTTYGSRYVTGLRVVTRDSSPGQNPI